jgi:hypothetical protein
MSRLPDDPRHDEARRALAGEALRGAAGDFSAGDLEREEAEAFRRLLAEDPRLEDECAFWRRVRPTLCGARRDPAAPGPAFAEALVQRACRERQDRPVVLRLPVWAMGVGSVAAVAAVLALALVLRGGEPTARMFGEDGTAVVPQSQEWDEYMPAALVSRVAPGSAVVAHERHRPWLGVWTRPVLLTIDGQDGAGHLVLRVAGGSPAYAIGLHPGDVIQRVDGCALRTSSCLARKLAGCQPGQSLRMEWVRPSTGERFARELRAETVYE